MFSLPSEQLLQQSLLAPSGNLVEFVVVPALMKLALTRRLKWENRGNTKPRFGSCCTMTVCTIRQIFVHPRLNQPHMHCIKLKWISQQQTFFLSIFHYAYPPLQVSGQVAPLAEGHSAPPAGDRGDSVRTWRQHGCGRQRGQLSLVAGVGDRPGGHRIYPGTLIGHH